MNVLLFVTSLLMILSMLTYAKIDSFRYFLGMEAQFERYMRTIEQDYTNSVAQKWYRNTKTRSGGGGGAKVADASPLLSFRVFIDSQLRSSNPELHQNTLKWAKSLMVTLYGNQSFFKEAAQKNPHFMDEMFEGVSHAAEQLTPEQKKHLKNAADLSNLNLGPQLEPTFYQMLKGCPVETPKEPIKAMGQPTFSVVLEEGNHDNEDSDNGEEAEEQITENGYDSLLNYVTLAKASKVRVYLASRTLLQAISGQAISANSIIEARYSLYQSIKNSDQIPPGTSEQFRGLVQGYLGTSNDAFLDFTVTKTNPSKYN